MPEWLENREDDPAHGGYHGVTFDKVKLPIHLGVILVVQPVQV